MKPFAQRTVLRYIYFHVAVAITVLTIGLTYWLWLDIQKDRYRDLQYVSKVIKSYYMLSLKQWELSLNSVGIRLLEIEDDKSGIQRYTFAKKALNEYDQLLAFGLADTTGQVTTFTEALPGDSLPHLTRSPITRRSFQQTLKAKQLVIGEVYFFINLADWVLPLRVPMFDENGDVVAVNTSAVQYSSMAKELGSFGIDPRYRIHLINRVYNTTQFYHPLPSIYNHKILRNADTVVFSNWKVDSKDGNQFVVSGFNKIELHPFIGVSTPLEGYDHDLVITVDESIIISHFFDLLKIIIAVYAILMLLVSSLFRFFKNKELSIIAALEIERANLKALFESTNNIIGLFDTEKRLQEFNRAFVEYSKIANEVELTAGMKVLESVKNKEFGANLEYLLDRSLRGEKFKQMIEYPTRSKLFYFMLSFNPIYRGGKIVGVSLFAEDITPLRESQMALEKYSENLEHLVEERTDQIAKKNADLEEALVHLHETQQQLLQSEKMASLGTLAAGIGHEINNPLNFIQNGLYALLNTIESNPSHTKADIQPFIEIIEEGVKRSTTIVKSLSHFSRKGVKMDEICNVHDILDNCLVILNNQLKNRINIIKKYADRSITTIGSEGKLHQAFINIITNAAQSIKDKGTITISTYHFENKIRVSILDTGVGIPSEHLDKIRDPFYTTKAPGEGTGLGLFITSAIIEEHKGKILVNSKLNEGTEFIVEI